MCPHPAAADTIRTLIAAVPDERLRELFLELALAALAVPAVEEPKGAALQRIATGEAPKRPGRKPKKVEGEDTHGNGATVSAAALW